MLQCTVGWCPRKANPAPATVAASDSLQQGDRIVVGQASSQLAFVG
jgi:hypothetical protein